VSELKSLHLDDFALLRHVAGELAGEELENVAQHLEVCQTCSRVQRKIRELDEELRGLARLGVSPEEPSSSSDLAPGDPFRSRPPVVERRAPRGTAGNLLAARALAASEQALGLCERILESARESKRLADVFSEMSLSEASHRFALLYALQESGRQIASSPVRSLRFAEETLARLRRAPFGPEAIEQETERIVPRLALRAQAHLLAGQACNWTKEFDRARSHLELAYRSFARGGGDEVSLAIVEYTESQRRSFIGRGSEALSLAFRAAATFQEVGLEDLLARARVAQGLALFDVGRQEEAIAVYRDALPIFERHNLWSNYVGTLNSIGASLARAGRLDEARREYARALRRLSRERDRSFVAYIRHGLADVLFAAGRYREAAISLGQASRLYRGSGLVASALIASLFEVESWARHGDLPRARHRLDLFLAEAARNGALDGSVVREIDAALCGSHPDLERIADLRQETEGILQKRLGLAPA
jgi:tetratricopeptide (TPR) repeat protein